MSAIGLTTAHRTSNTGRFPLSIATAAKMQAVAIDGFSDHCWERRRVSITFLRFGVRA
jgi:hypothetical protein